MGKLTDKLSHAWNAFVDQNPEEDLKNFGGWGTNYGVRPGVSRPMFASDKSIISAIYTRLCIDVASNDIRHVRLDTQGRYSDDYPSGLNDCLTLEANLDQSALAFLLDVAYTLFDKGVAVLVPVDTSVSPLPTGGYDIKTMRVGEIVNFYPNHVRVSLYNERRGIREEITLPKRTVAIIENPFYSVMNEPSSTLQRLMRKLALLDVVDEASSSGKLDLIIQLPYVVKSDLLRARAEQRAKDIEFQLTGSKYGIAYTDGTEKITQLNRPAENNLMAQVEYLFAMLYNQLGLTEEIMKGTADEATMLNYQNRTIAPILTAIIQAMKRTFLTKTARTQNQSIMYFRDPFKLVSMKDIAEIADKLGRNEVVSSNEVRGFIGLRPSKDPKADELRNSNMPDPTVVNPATPPQIPPAPSGPASSKGGVSQNGS